MSYSQNDEEAVILNHFGQRKGRLLDIGAHDGTSYSNSRTLLEHGWSGVLVEPDPRSLSKLIDSVRLFGSRVEVIAAAACGHSSGPQRLWIDSAPNMEWASGITNFMPRPIREALNVMLLVPALSISDILAYGPFDFITVDAEGMDFEILQAMPRPLPCELICLEPYFEQGRVDMKAYLADCAFQVIHETKDNLIAKRI